MSVAHDVVSLMTSCICAGMIVAGAARAAPPDDPVLQALVKGDQETACRLAVKQRDHGEFFSGTCYETGTGIEQDFDRAAELFRTAMRKYRHQLAQAHLGQLMAMGHVPGGMQEGLKLLRSAAEHGGPESEMLYGRWLAEMPHARREALRWLKRSVASGFPGGAYELARVHQESGDARAAEFWRAKGRELEAQRGTFADLVAFVYSGEELASPDANYDRAMRILSGKEAGDAEQAVELLRDAARFEAKAELQLGLMHQRGVAFPADRDEAIYWFRRAALHGSAEGEALLRKELERSGSGGSSQ